ncbi:hypothetical protein HYFRA_00001771 [Hymenoscyphus fraxineus]|uniref:Uncharacterized protein n=1 Tax=Hymenoscyphus fraxineus TaxID=746836 RepID=A0A9N9PJI6_9HELO|nr:hypothetical protein HYFRA_00001771 [Hymenoscyphus fraxineus]
MLFKSFRSKSSSKSTNNSSMAHRTSMDAHSHTAHYTQGDAMDTKGPTTTIMSSPESGKTTGSDDYQKFIEKSRKDAEREEKRKLKELKEAERRRQEVNMSPWASRM